MQCNINMKYYILFVKGKVCGKNVEVKFNPLENRKDYVNHNTQ
jgi:hypothetical protein